MNENPVTEVATLINSNGVRVVEFALSPNANGVWHHHSEMLEHCYCLNGRLTIEIAGAKPAYLSPGNRYELPAGVKHRIRNEENHIASFLVIQGIGTYDFIQSEDAL